MHFPLFSSKIRQIKDSRSAAIFLGHETCPGPRPEKQVVFMAIRFGCRDSRDKRGRSDEAVATHPPQSGRLRIKRPPAALPPFGSFPPGSKNNLLLWRPRGAMRNKNRRLPFREAPVPSVFAPVGARPLFQRPVAGGGAPSRRVERRTVSRTGRR